MIGPRGSGFLLLLALAACAAPGRREHLDVDFAGGRIRVWTYEPSSATPDSRVVIVLHGVLRNGEEYREPWIPIADRRGCVVLVPEFSEREWPGSRSYHQGNTRDVIGRPNPEERWTYSAIDAVFDRYRAASGNRTERYFIFGHSAGAQFLHRMILLKPDARYEAAFPANAGMYTLPDLDAEWTRGLKGTATDAARLKRVLERRVVVLLGEADTDPEDKYLPKGRDAMAQGPHRFARGRHFYEKAKAAAAALGADFRWELRTVPGVGHDNAKMAPAAAEAMFGP
jgi:poly(3-hydroxybutyrate) depolymerase